MKVLVTGTAGFIGSATALRLLERGDEVVGVDNLNPYYDVELKKARLRRKLEYPGFTEITADIADRGAMEQAFREHQPQRVINLAAQAGVRYSLENPHVYVDSNVVGFLNILECCRHHDVESLVYASTSSVYGGNTRMPFSPHDDVGHPLTLYAATKRANELMAHTYSHLFGLPATGLRFFTVYGPWGRPDMALFRFTRAILAGEPIDVYNYGRHRRDFTYIDDIVDGVVRVLDRIPSGSPDWSGDAPDPATSSAPFRVYNIGNSKPVELERYIEVIEQCLDRKADRNLLPMQPGDVPDTYADVTDLTHDTGYRPRTSVEVGVRNFVDWYLSYYGRRS
ncbi:MAG TPA: NAD-dependent epimerase [Gammaproteobacteria bacterium]|nr:NAD-dependent epimerase [Gammaproteobacteria bacterium]